MRKSQQREKENRRMGKKLDVILVSQLLTILPYRDCIFQTKKSWRKQKETRKKSKEIP